MKKPPNISSQHVGIGGGWRTRLLYEAYKMLPNAEGTHRQVTDIYIDLAKQQNHSLPKDLHSTMQALKSALQRCSSDSIHYTNELYHWNTLYPDIFYQLEKGRWGIRPEIIKQTNKLNLMNDSLLVGILPYRPSLTSNILTLGLLEANGIYDNRKVYVMESLPIPGKQINLPGVRFIKIGISVNPANRRDELQVGNPAKIIILKIIECVIAPALENILHTILANKRLESEWFSTDDTELKEICNSR